MATDVLSRTVTYGGAFSADGAKLTFSSTAGGINFNSTGLLVQQARWTYQQMITRLYDIGSANVYLVAGRTQGQLQLARVLGPQTLMTAFYTQFGNVCNAANNNISLSATAGCGSAQTTNPKWTISHAVISSIGGGIENAEQMIISEMLEFIFLCLSIA